MVLSDKAMRAWKLATVVATSFTAFYSIFEADYSHVGQDHVFSDLQGWYRKKKQKLLLGNDTESIRKDIDKKRGEK